MLDASAFQLLLMDVTGWLARREREVFAYLIEENRCLRRQLGMATGNSIRWAEDEVQCAAGPLIALYRRERDRNATGANRGTRATGARAVFFL